MTVPGSLRARYEFKGSAAHAGFRGWLGSVCNMFWRLRVSSVQQVAVLVSLLAMVTAVVEVRTRRQTTWSFQRRHTEVGGTRPGQIIRPQALTGAAAARSSAREAPEVEASVDPVPHQE